MKRLIFAGLAAFGAAAIVPVAGAQMRRPDPATMAAYVLGMYTKGPKWTAERTPHTDSIQAGHMANMGRMAATGSLIGAGPFGGDGRMRGLLIFKDIPMDSAHTMVARDPALKAERLMIELHRWYAPRGIGDAYAARARLRPENPDSMIMLPVAIMTRPAQVPAGDSAAAAAAVAGHMGHTLDMMISGQLLAAGPFFDDGPLRGISFFGTDSTTARKLVLDDPAVKAGRLGFAMLPWWTAWGVMPPSPKIKEKLK